MQAIDLIDEAGSRVRLRHAQLPEEARDLDKELRALLKEKDAAVRGQVGRPVLLASKGGCGSRSGILDGFQGCIWVPGAGVLRGGGAVDVRMHCSGRLALCKAGFVLWPSIAAPLVMFRLEHDRHHVLDVAAPPPFRACHGPCCVP